jgi:tRNA dimethylallyltransferase
MRHDAPTMRPHREGDKPPPALIIAGPTCSGKSALALALSEQLGGTVINADAMQVYRELHVLTARPSTEEMERVPHRLYGVRTAAEASSVAWWREAALAELNRCHAAGRLPILCGGSGMYLAALTGGIAPIPDPGETARAEARGALADSGPRELYARLREVDPDTADRLRPTDTQRVARAWEVWRGTGRGIAAWQAERLPAAPYRFTAILLAPDRAALRDAIQTRFTQMLAQGAIEEVTALLALNLDPSLPAMRAHGVPELTAYLRGEITVDEAGRRTRLVTGQYTKRQATWFRHHALASPERTHTIHARIPAMQQFSESFMRDLRQFIVPTG